MRTPISFCHSCRPLFEMLDGFDICMAPAPGEIPIRAGEVPYARIAGLVPFNTGVILYRRNRRVRAMLELGEQLYRDLDARHFCAGHPDRKRSDQPYLTLAIARTDVRFYALRNNWNFRACFPEIATGTVNLIHARLQDAALVAGRLNASTRRRLWDPRTEQVRLL